MNGAGFILYPLKFSPVPLLENVGRILAGGLARMLVATGDAAQLWARRFDSGERVEQVVVVTPLGQGLAVRVAGIELVAQFPELVLKALGHASRCGDPGGFKHLGKLCAGAVTVDFFEQVQLVSAKGSLPGGESLGRKGLLEAPL